MLGVINLFKIVIISILTVLGGFILVTLIVSCIKSLIKQISQIRK